MSVVIIIGSVAIEFAVIWWFITRQYRRPKSFKRFLSGLVLVACLFFSPLLHIAMIRQIVERRALADSIVPVWVILEGACALIFMITVLYKSENKTGGRH